MTRLVFLLVYRHAASGTIRMKRAGIAIALIAALGAIVLAIYPQYCDCHGRAQTDSWMVQLNDVMVDIEDTLLSGKKSDTQLTALRKNSLAPPNAESFEIATTGVISIKGAGGSPAILLTPIVIRQHIVWHCDVQPELARPRQCKPYPKLIHF